MFYIYLVDWEQDKVPFVEGKFAVMHSYPVLSPQLLHANVIQFVSWAHLHFSWNYALVVCSATGIFPPQVYTKAWHMLEHKIVVTCFILISPELCL